MANSEFVYVAANLTLSAAAIIQIADQRVVTLECINETGLITIEHLDPDMSGSITSGDTVNVTYEACSGADGVFSIAISRASTIGAVLDQLSGRVTVSLHDTDRKFPISLESSQDMSFTLDNSVLRWLSTNAVVEVSVGGTVLEILDGTVDKSIDADSLTYEVTISGTGAINGEQFDLSTTETFSGAVESYPVRGRLLLEAGLAQAEMSIGTQVDLSLFSIGVDPDGSGTFDEIGLFRLDEFVSGILFEFPPSEDEPPDDEPPGEPPILSDLKGRRIDLGGAVHDGVIDDARNRIYFSIPERSEIAIVDAETLNAIDYVFVGPRPHGLSLSEDGSTLYAALFAAGAVAALNLDTLTYEILPVGAASGHPSTYDVVEASPDELYVTAAPGSGSFAYLARIDRDMGDTATRANTAEIIRIDPELLLSADRQWLYVGERDYLYKFDIGNPAAPLVLREFVSAGRIQLSPDESRIYTRSGRVLSTDTFLDLGQIGVGVPVPRSNGADVMLGTHDYSLEIYSTSDFGLVDRLSTDCDISEPLSALLPLDEAGQWLFVGAGICAVDLNTPYEPPGTDSPDRPPLDVPVTESNAIQTALPGVPGDLEFDAARQRFYISFPSDGIIVSYSSENLDLIETFDIGSMPRGIHLDPTGNELAVALQGTGELGFLDVGSGLIEKYDLTAELGHPGAYDVAWLTHDAIFVGVHTNLESDGYVVRTTRGDPAGAAIRVAGEEIIRYLPVLVGDRASMRVYAAEDVSPNALYVLNAAQATAPIIVRDETRDLSGVRRMTLSPDGHSLALAFQGQILRSSDLTQKGLVGRGIPAYSFDSLRIAITEHDADLHFYDDQTFIKQSILESDCSIRSADRVVEIPSTSSWAVMGDQLLCILPTDASPAPPGKIERAPSSKMLPPYRCDDDCLIRRWVGPNLIVPNQPELVQ